MYSGAHPVGYSEEGRHILEGGAVAGFAKIGFNAIVFSDVISDPTAQIESRQWGLGILF